MNQDAVAGVRDAALASLLHDQWEDSLARSPLSATRLGDHRYDHLLDDVGPEARDDARRARAGFLARARAIDPAGLAPTDRTTLELLVGDLEASERVDACALEQWDLSTRRNPLMVAGELGEGQEVRSPAEADAWLNRARALPRLVAQDRDNLREGIRSGRTPNAASVRLVIEQFDRVLAQDPATWAFLGPALAAHPEWPAGAAARFRDDAVAFAADALRPALADYRTFLQDELLPAARPDDKIGTWALPDGEACYAALIQRETSLPLDAREIHKRGLLELVRIHDEMRVLGERLFGTSDLPTIFARLRGDGDLHFRTSDEVEAKAREALARANATVPQLFGRLPKAGCEVRRIPDHEAPYTTIAYYWPVVPGGERPGYYYVNTYAPETRPRFEAEALAFHESVPGHHLQIAIAQEVPALPAFRRHLFVNAFLEGWALYTERLADEVGLYSGDLDRMGMLSFDTWRASRLVVDTGVHALGWTRERAERFMVNNTPLAENNIRNEVDRYVTWPAQALAYKIGQMEILALRRDAEARLGPRFDLRAFHDAVLSGGAVTLPVLRREVEAWIATVEAP